MKNKLIIVLIAVLTISFTAVSSYGDDYDPTEEGYQKMRTEVFKLFREKKYSEGVIILEKNLNKYPNHFMANSFNLALFYGSLKKFKKGTKVLLNAQKKGMWFSIWALEGDFFKGFKQYKGFSKVLTLNKKLQAAAEAKAKSFFEVRKPENFDPEKTYPLFIALHGGDGTIKGFRPRWDSEKMKKEFITLFVQSSQMSSMAGYHWEDTERTHSEVKDAFLKVSEKYKINKKKIIIGGFSSGGGASLHLTFNGDIPIVGFIALCPALPVTIDEDKISDAVKKGVSGTFLTTEFDNRIKAHRVLADKMKKKGLQYQFVVTPNMGHWFPKDLDKKIDQAIVHIFSR